MTTPSSSKDPLHGVTLEAMLTELSAHYGWEEMGRRINIKCFTTNPSVKSSLTFLRKTPWARGKVEVMYRWYREKQMKAEQKTKLTDSPKYHQ
jgi:uncharacterized protein (DUF2132 family)